MLDKNNPLQQDMLQKGYSEMEVLEWFCDHYKRCMEDNLPNSGLARESYEWFKEKHEEYKKKIEELKSPQSEVKE